jgi:hypothetical protein
VLLTDTPTTVHQQPQELELLIVDHRPQATHPHADQRDRAREAAVDWCPNLDCPSNHALPGLVRVGVNLYVCSVCGEELSGPFSAYGGHRNLHG